jgi:hypothetical protein
MTTSSSQVVKELAKATGVSENDVAKVLNKLGFEQRLVEATKRNNGVEPRAGDALVAFKLGKSTIIA